MEIKVIEYVVFFSLLFFAVVLSIIYKPKQKESNPIFEINKCESPIERRQYNGLIQHNIYPVSQHKVGPYRIDLAILHCRIAIEADGKGFHSAPKQKTHDRKKDKYLKERGWIVLRFSGRKIHRELPRVVEKIKQYLDGNNTS